MLWNLNGALPARVAVVGKSPSLRESPASAARLFASAKPEPVLNVIGVLSGSHPHIDYFVLSATGPTRFAVYAESAALPANRLAIARNSAFSDLNYALYLGKNEQTSDLLATSLAHRPIAGRRAAITFPFGTTALDFVVTPKGPLSSGGCVRSSLASTAPSSWKEVADATQGCGAAGARCSGGSGDRALVGGGARSG